MPADRSIKLYYIHLETITPDKIPVMDALKELASFVEVEAITEPESDAELVGKVLNALVAKSSDASAELRLALLHVTDVDAFFNTSLEAYAAANPQQCSAQDVVTLYFTKGNARVYEKQPVVAFNRLRELLVSPELKELVETCAPKADFQNLFRWWTNGPDPLLIRTALDVRIQAARMLLTSADSTHQEACRELKQDPRNWFTNNLNLQSIQETDRASDTALEQAQVATDSDGPLERIVRILTDAPPSPETCKELLDVDLLGQAHEQFRKKYCTSQNSGKG